MDIVYNVHLGSVTWLTICLHLFYQIIFAIRIRISFIPSLYIAYYHEFIKCIFYTLNYINTVISIYLKKLLCVLCVLSKLWTLSGSIYIGKVVASHVDRSLQGRFLARLLLCMRRSRGTAHEGVGNGKSIGSTVSDAIVSSWLWSTATRSCQLGYFSSISASSWLLTPQTVHGRRFSCKRLLAIDDFTFLLPHFVQY